MSNSYTAIAQYYDIFSQNDCDYPQWSQYLYAVARKHSAQKVVDIACGTGKMTVLLQKMGLSVTGVDISEQMLAVAQQKCRAVFVCQDMRKLALPTRSQMAVCVNDGVNYLKPSELTAFFAQVAQNLKAGAPFVFDVSSPYKLTQVLGNNIFFDDGDNQTLLWTNTLHANSVTMNLTLFDKGANNTYTRQDESHTQYIHTTEAISSSLTQAGFTLVEVTEYGALTTDKSLRLTYYATKN